LEITIHVYTSIAYKCVSIITRNPSINIVVNRWLIMKLLYIAEYNIESIEHGTQLIQGANIYVYSSRESVLYLTLYNDIFIS
jgi:hypothetical protein